MWQCCRGPCATKRSADHGESGPGGHPWPPSVRCLQATSFWHFRFLFARDRSARRACGDGPCHQRHGGRRYGGTHEDSALARLTSPHLAGPDRRVAVPGVSDGSPCQPTASSPTTTTAARGGRRLGSRVSDLGFWSPCDLASPRHRPIRASPPLRAAGCTCLPHRAVVALARLCSCRSN